MTALLSQITSDQPDAPVMLLFGGNPWRRDEVLQLIQELGAITAYGCLSEAEGLDLLRQLPQLDLLLIGGRYDAAARRRIRDTLAQQWPGVPVTEPGWDYPYQNQAIAADILRKLPIRQGLR